MYVKFPHFKAYYSNAVNVCSSNNYRLGKRKKQGSSLMSKYFAVVLMLLLIPSVISSAKVLDSFRKQDALLKDFGAQKF